MKRRWIVFIWLTLLLANSFAQRTFRFKSDDLATYTVTTTADSGLGSLRQAIIDANSNPGTDTIQFNIPGSGPFVINLSQPLPDITDPVIIDGYTQSGSSPASTCSGVATIRIVLNGSGAGPSASGFVLAPGSQGSTIKGLSIINFSGSGIEVLSGSNSIVGNFIGINASGGAAGNGTGILISSGNANTIGGNSPADRNVISGNQVYGIRISGFGGTSNNVITGNYIGTNPAGNAAVANGMDGISIINSSGNSIGGSTTNLGCAPGNLISGNLRDGIDILGASSNNTVQGNLVGLNSNGSVAIPNGSEGIYVTGSNNLIGGSNANLRNVISGNGGSGVTLSGDSNQVNNNFIGTDINGTTAIGNKNGVRIDNNSTNNRIGGVGLGNLISGNEVGVEIQEGANNTIQGNLIGTTANGMTALGNTEAGIYIHQATSTGNLIGGTLSGEGNVIMFNGDGTPNPVRFGEGGIVVFAGATGNRILGNSIDLNTGLGIDLGALNANGVTPNDPLDSDSGNGNNYQNFPVIVSATTSGSTTMVSGTLSSTPNRTFRVEFFSVPAADSSGNGEGRTFRAAVNVTTNALGVGTINATIAPAIPVGQFITATATDNTTGDTSEFSAAVQVQAPTAAGVTVSGRVTNAHGRALPNVRVILTDQNGLSRVTVTNSFGYYYFRDVEAGQTYVIEAKGRYRFRPLVVDVNEDTTVDIVAEY